MDKIKLVLFVVLLAVPLALATSVCESSCQGTSSCETDSCPSGFSIVSEASYPEGCAEDTPVCCCSLVDSDDNDTDTETHESNRDMAEIPEFSNSVLVIALIVATLVFFVFHKVHKKHLE